MGLPSWCNRFQGRAIQSASSLGGGHGQGVFKISADGTPYPMVVKCFAHPDQHAMAVGEAESLRTIHKAVPGLAPQVYDVIHHPRGSCVFMEYIANGAAEGQSGREVGQKLANMHNSGAQDFGFHCDTFIGGIRQNNLWLGNWHDFYVNHRLIPLFSACFNRGHFTSGHQAQFERLCDRFQSMLPKVTPSLLHGDLWNGNRISSGRGPVLIDACCFYGHNEMDLAMMQLFGGFQPETFRHYHELIPAVAGIDERLQIYSLYYLLVHVRLFGEGYTSSCKRIFSRFQ